MKSTDRTEASHLPAVNIKAQLAAIHNTTFPFSSPNIDGASLRSGRTGNTALSRNPLESPGSLFTPLTDYESGGTSDYDEWHLERYSQQTADEKSRNLHPRTAHNKKRSRPGLHVVTSFPKPNYRPNDLVVAEVQAKQAQARPNKARSVVSQKGIKIDPGTPSSESSTKLLTNLKELIHSKRSKRQALIASQDALHVDNESQIRRTVLTGPRVLNGEAKVLQEKGNLENHNNLDTPCTPAIILTPPIERLAPFMTLSRNKPASSIYSITSENRDDDSLSDQGTPLMPSNTPGHANGGQTLMSRNPFRKQHELDLAHLGDDEASSANTPRSKSDGWWTLMLSPMLSRAGSIVSRRGHDVNDSLPPVPAIPTELEKQLSAMTPPSHMSPETPRRLGLASPHGSSWSQWTEMNQDAPTDHETSDAPRGEREAAHLNGKEFPLIIANSNTSEGLAAEYFHACAVEQLAGIAYFECINHSCSEHWPKLRSIFDSAHQSEEALQGRHAKRDTTSTRGLAILPLSIEAKDTEIDQMELSEKGKPASTSLNTISSRPREVKQSSLPVAVSVIPEENLVPSPVDSEDEPDELSPTVRKANTAAVVRARALGGSKPTLFQPARAATHVDESLPNIASVVPDVRSAKALEVTPANTKMSPALDKAVPSSCAASKAKSSEVEPRYGLGLTSTPHHEAPNQQVFPPPPHQLPPNQLFFNGNTSYPEIPKLDQSNPLYPYDTKPPKRSQSSDRSEHAKLQEKKAFGHDSNMWKRCFSRKKSASDDQNTKKKKKRRQRWLCCIVIFLLAIIAICLALAMTLTRRGDATPVNSRWLNLTGYPPMPTGISTIAQPNLARAENRCTSPETLWSCSLPKEDQVTVEPNKPDQPNFRFEIKFRNGTTPADMTIATHKRATDPFTNELFTASPSPPSQLDQVFLGETTDNVTAPFDGEITPFYITFMSTYPAVPSSFNLTKRLSSRQDNLRANIPAPAVADDGTATPAVLLPTDPFPVSQPIKLYNRGKNDEHYGFYMYYDKSIFLSGITMKKGNASSSVTSPVDDQNGGTTKVTANARCTWQQTRFLVKMYTNPLFDAVLLDGGALSGNSSKNTDDKYSSATDFTRPGSFPYPTTLAIDRHGGNINYKITYCYGMTGEKINIDEQQLFRENRAFGGQLVNPAPSLVVSDGYKFNTSAGGIDGGLGGCGCWWQNWR